MNGPILEVVSYQIKSHPAYPHELDLLRYCVLVMGQDMSCLRILGEVKVDRPSSFVQSELELSSEKELGLKEAVVTSEKRPFSRSELRMAKSSTQTEKRERNLSFLAPLSPVERWTSWESEREEECVLYVTKFQKEMEDVYRTKMFHEYVWDES